MAADAPAELPPPDLRPSAQSADALPGTGTGCPLFSPSLGSRIDLRLFALFCGRHFWLKAQAPIPRHKRSWRGSAATKIPADKLPQRGSKIPATSALIVDAPISATETRFQRGAPLRNLRMPCRGLGLDARFAFVESLQSQLARQAIFRQCYQLAATTPAARKTRPKSIWIEHITAALYYTARHKNESTGNHRCLLIRGAARRMFV